MTGVTGALEVRCLKCNALAGIHYERGPLMVALMDHYSQAHDTRSMMMLEGHHFLIEPAPHRCDLCGVVAEPPWWTYVTPPTATYTCEDPNWLVCDGCDALLQADEPLPALLERALRVQIENTAGQIPEDLIQLHLQKELMAFLHHRAGEPTRYEP